MVYFFSAGPLEKARTPPFFNRKCKPANKNRIANDNKPPARIPSEIPRPLLGDLSRTSGWPWLLGLLAGAAVAGTLLGRHLNVLARGVTQAASVGLDVERLQVLLFVLSSLLTGVAVSAAGSIGFIGLVTPHLVRLALGSDNRIVLPVSALLGGVLLMAADLASRTLIAPRQLPVGALTALVGVPVFLVLMSRRRAG